MAKKKKTKVVHEQPDMLPMEMPVLEPSACTLNGLLASCAYQQSKLEWLKLAEKLHKSVSLSLKPNGFITMPSGKSWVKEKYNSDTASGWFGLDLGHVADKK
jgi:hypothetical protein